MTHDTEANRRSPSATTQWKYAKIAIRPKDPANESPQEAFRRLPWREQTSTIHCMVTYHGGPQCWWQIEARGRVYRVTGDLALHDVFAAINSGELVGKKARSQKGANSRR